MGMAEFANITERRIEKMTDPNFSHLPAFLVDNPGLNSGFMIAHVTAAALASENKVLCHPASVDSIPTSTDKEDHVSMGITAGLKLHQVIKNLKFNMAIEMLCNSQAIDYRRPHNSSKVLEKVFDCIRKHVPKVKEDRAFYKDINKLVELIDSREILNIVEAEIGSLD
jgi:histidine ammonia-lyase